MKIFLYVDLKTNMHVPQFQLDICEKKKKKKEKPRKYMSSS